MVEYLRLLNTGFLDAPLNMALDEVMLNQYIQGKAPPTLRVFRWQQPTISLGRFQGVERELEMERCTQLGVALVRRPTGGRAVYHRDDFTYSMVIGKRERVPSGVVAAYAYLAQGLLAALNLLGVEAEVVTTRQRTGTSADTSVSHAHHPSAACFASSTQADLTSGGLKLVGSAQVWKEEGLLQQGSIPLDDHAVEFFSLLHYPSVLAREEALAEYYEKTQPLHRFVPSASWNDVADAFARGFSKALQTEVIAGEVSAAEWKLAEQLVAEKYSKLEWRKERVRIVE